MAAEYLNVESKRELERNENENKADRNEQAPPNDEELVEIVRNNLEMQEGGDEGNVDQWEVAYGNEIVEQLNDQGRGEPGGDQERNIRMFFKDMDGSRKVANPELPGVIQLPCGLVKFDVLNAKFLNDVWIISIENEVLLTN